jgi:hypothetical protein
LEGLLAGLSSWVSVAWVSSAMLYPGFEEPLFFFGTGLATVIVLKEG